MSAHLAVAVWRPAKPGETPGQLTPQATTPADCRCVHRDRPDWGQVTEYPPGGCPTHPIPIPSPGAAGPAAAHLPGQVGLPDGAGPQ